MKTLGYDLASWAAAKAEVLEIVRNRAAESGLISYSEVTENVRAIELDPRSPALAELLDQLSEGENEAGRGMISAIVVHREGVGHGQPGLGFFELARTLGKNVSDHDAFWLAEVRKVHKANGGG